MSTIVSPAHHLSNLPINGSPNPLSKAILNFTVAKFDHDDYALDDTPSSDGSTNSNLGLTRSASTSSYTTQTETEAETPLPSPVRVTTSLDAGCPTSDTNVIHVVEPCETFASAPGSTLLDEATVLRGLKHPTVLCKTSPRLGYLAKVRAPSDEGYEAEAENAVKPRNVLRPKSIRLENGMWRRRGEREPARYTPASGNRGRPIVTTAPPAETDSQVTPTSSPTIRHPASPPMEENMTPAVRSRPETIDLSSVSVYQPPRQSYAGLGLGLPSTASSSSHRTASSIVSHRPTSNLTLAPPMVHARAFSAPSAHSPRASPIFFSPSTFSNNYHRHDVSPRMGGSEWGVPPAADAFRMPKAPRLQPLRYMSDISPLMLPTTAPTCDISFPVATDSSDSARNSRSASPKRIQTPPSHTPTTERPPFRSKRSSLTLLSSSSLSSIPLPPRIPPTLLGSPVLERFGIGSGLTRKSSLRNVRDKDRFECDGSMSSSAPSPLCTPLRMFMAASAPSQPMTTIVSALETEQWGSPPLGPLGDWDDGYAVTPSPLDLVEPYSIDGSAAGGLGPGALPVVDIADKERNGGADNFNPYFASAVF